MSREFSGIGNDLKVQMQNNVIDNVEDKDDVMMDLRLRLIMIHNQTIFEVDRKF